MDATGEAGDLPQATRLTSDPAPEFGSGVNDSQVTWSPDASRIAFVSQGRGDDQDSCDLWAMDPTDTDRDGFGDNLQRLTFDESSNCDAFEDMTPQWSPNSSLIAYTSVRTGYFDIWLVNADDPSDLRNVTKTPSGYEDQPSWSPDGTQVIFRKTVDGVDQLFSLPVPPPSVTDAEAVPGDRVGPANTAGVAETSSAGTTTPSLAPTQLTFGDQDKSDADWGAETGVLPGTATLTVRKVGHGNIRSAPVGVACGKDCLSTYVEATVVTLTARPKPGFVFKRWGGACSGTQPTCSVTAGASRPAVARFVPVG